MRRVFSERTIVAVLACWLAMLPAHAQTPVKKHAHSTTSATARHATATLVKRSAATHTNSRSTHASHSAASSHTGHAKASSSRRSRTLELASERHGRRARHVVPVKATAESRRLTSAFVASAQLRPMAQELVLLRTPAAYNGVQAYAATHPGDGAAAADLALGHAYMLDRRYPEAEAAFHQAATRSTVLTDYADYLEAHAAVQGNRPNDAIPLLQNFADRHPGSLFLPNAPILLANAYIASGNPAEAVHVLLPLRAGDDGSHVGFRFALAHAYQASGDTAQAAMLYRGIYLGDPVSPEAANARTQLLAMNLPLSPAERKQHADAMFDAKQYTEAETEYRELRKNDSALSQADRDALEIYAAVCDLRLKKLSRGDVEHLPVTSDDSAALKMYLQSELARNDGKTDEHDALVQQMMTQYPHSRWLEEALYSGGNMYLLKHDNQKAIEAYMALVQRFPHSIYAPNAHWRAAWLNYRQRNYPEAARLMDEQITSYPAGDEIPGALYWRGRLYEDVEHNFGQALNYYTALNSNYVNSYYAILGRQRTAIIGDREAAAPAPALAAVRDVDDPGFTDDLPENDPHLIKARLLANAALNEYIRPEIELSSTSDQWGAFAEADIYQSFGESTRALQAMKRSKIPFFSLAMDDVPLPYWQIVFPRPYWPQLSSDAQAAGLDPFLVASLIRQESEFNPGAVSRANAYGLMQLLPSVGKSLAKKEGDRHFNTNELLNPTTNLQLGTVDLRKSIDRYNGQVEYALAAYNAGDTPVRQWIALNDYKDIPEWVESIPYSETRNYVESILRNREMYRAVYADAHEGALQASTR